MPGRDIEYTVTISKSGSPTPRWNQPHILELLAKISKRILEEKQLLGEETTLNPENGVTGAG